MPSVMQRAIRPACPARPKRPQAEQGPRCISFSYFLFSPFPTKEHRGLIALGSLERPLSATHIGRFKPLCDFDWTWPKPCDRAAVDALITLDFLKEAANVLFVGPNGVGKSMFARNIAYRAVTDGHTVLFTSGAACALMPDHSCSSLMRSAIYPTPTVAPTCCSNRSRVAIRIEAR